MEYVSQKFELTNIYVNKGGNKMLTRFCRRYKCGRLNAHSISKERGSPRFEFSFHNIVTVAVVVYCSSSNIYLLPMESLVA